jgi:hypothetical protein
MSTMTVTAPRRPLVTSTEVLVAVLVVSALAGAWMRDGVAGNLRLATAGTVFSGVFLQAVPFLVLGVLISGLIAAFVSPQRLARWLPRNAAAAVLTAVVAGAALPGCECGSVPVARRLFGDGGGGCCGTDVHAQCVRDQPGVAGGHRGGQPGSARHGAGPLRGLAGDRGGDGCAVVTLGSPGLGEPTAAAIRPGGPVTVDGIWAGMSTASNGRVMIRRADRQARASAPMTRSATARMPSALGWNGFGRHGSNEPAPTVHGSADQA